MEILSNGFIWVDDFYKRPSLVPVMSEQVTEQLSEEAVVLKKLCDTAAETVASSIDVMVGEPESGQILRMGADGTPTKNIDRKAEDAVLSSLENSGLGFEVLSEEIGIKVIGEKPRYFLYLDPLDGTFNAVNGLPFYSVSIYICNQDLKFAYVFDLAQEIKYYAEAGGGAWSERKGHVRSLRVSETRSLSDFSISAYILRPRARRIVELADVVRRIRTLGSTSLELCLVACGKLDAFVDLREALRVVDVAAGNLIVEEAGGKVTDSRGKKIDLNGDMWQKRDLVVSNGLAHQKILNLTGGGRI
jgi:myo-inositol-1(or 4)-monophosphatase